ncbi:GSCFA domain-containing protein [Xanthomarina sp. GH4-25]|uniref:GSCFA domain-containing protein n=1 Tax=Xanthomarina sp. GH4-25 TaxID=3349335 RepID=UPI003877C9B1
MKLQTTIPLKKQPYNLIDYHSKLLLFGSCFVENMGVKLEYFKFQNLQNPFGILFQPLAIENLITNAINKKVYTEEDVFYFNEQWYSFETHSKFSSFSKEDLLHHLNEQIKATNKHIKAASHIIITLGTAWVYRQIETDTIVANCHKVPQKKFLKELLSIEAISESLQSIIALIKSVNDTATVIVTVSPVRHLKDGFVENTRSKAHLISAIHSLFSSRTMSKGLYYFPSYEIMMDELRDYRFYAEDMIHPSQTAISYIWERFQEVWMSNEASKTMEEVDAIQKGFQHKPFHPNSEAHKLFLQKLSDRKVKLQSHFSHISF